MRSCERVRGGLWATAPLLLWSIGCGDDGPATPPMDDAGVEDAASPDVDAGDEPPAWPERLSQTGLYADIATGELAEGVTPYTVRYPLWSDGAAKDRHLYLPPGGEIDASDMDGWIFPVGTKAWKAFTRDDVRVETRLLEKRADGWTMVSYVWLPDGTDAIATPDGLADAGGTSHDVPDTEDCAECHRGSRDGLLGMGALQQSGPEGLLATLAANGRLSVAPAEGGYDPPGTALDRAALGYLHANCGSCHSPWHPLATRRTQRYHVPVDAASVRTAPAYASTVGVEGAHEIEGARTLLVPGQPAASQLWTRMTIRGFEGMPPRGTELVDDDGVDLIADWITSLAP